MSIKEEDIVIGLGVLLGISLLSQSGRRETRIRSPTIIPLNPHIAGMTVGEAHITGINYKIGSYSSIGLVDTGTSHPTISNETAKKIHFDTFPLTSPLHSPKDPGTRLLPLEIPGLGVFPTPFIIGYGIQPALIPPDIWYKWYDITFTSTYAIFKTKSREPVIPYIKIEELAASDQEIIKKGISLSEKKEPIIPFSVGGVSFHCTLDTGFGVMSAISKHAASLLKIKQYPKKYIYNQDDFNEVHLVPVTIGGLTINMELSVSPRDIGEDHTTVITCEEFLRRGISVTFTEHGIRFG
jgi:hypothetical protein